MLVHQYEAPSWSLGRQTFTVQSSPHHQRTPVFGSSMVAWREDDPGSTATSVWYQPDGRLMAAERSLIARIGFDPAPWYVTTEAAVNPAADGYGPSLNGWPLIAYNAEVPANEPPPHS